MSLLETSSLQKATTKAEWLADLPSVFQLILINDELLLLDSAHRHSIFCL